MLTTENYPDVLLLAYDEAWYSVLFFFIFIVIGVFYLSSILLAIVFDNYKKRIEIMSESKIKKRMFYIKMFYD